jgi:hypothetical protein
MNKMDSVRRMKVSVLIKYLMLHDVTKRKLFELATGYVMSVNKISKLR